MQQENRTEAKLAWSLWHLLQNLNDLLWQCYEEDFINFAMEEEDQNWKLENLF